MVRAVVLKFISYDENMYWSIVRTLSYLRRYRSLAVNDKYALLGELQYQLLKCLTYRDMDGSIYLRMMIDLIKDDLKRITKNWCG